MIRTSDKTNVLLGALDAFAARALHVPKNATNPFYDSRYADLFSIKAICDPELRDQGLLVTQFPGGGESGHSTLITRLVHVPTGEFMEAEAHLTLAAENPQQVGSAITYMRRYAYCAILGIVADPDDDGNIASHRQASQGRPVPNQEFQEVNGEQIPTGFTDDPITRTGPGGVNAASITEKQGKMVYAVTKANYGDDANVSEVVSRLLGRPIKRTEETWVSELDGLVAKLKAKA